MPKSKVRKLTKAQQKKREALDYVLHIAMNEVRLLNGKKNGKPGQPLCLYDCAIWLLYACARDDARVCAEEGISECDKEHSTFDELNDSIDLVGDDHDSAITIFESQHKLGSELDPGYGEPILNQPSWI